MLRVAVGVFLILHGVIHGAIWFPPRSQQPLPGLGTQASWLVADVRAAVVSVAAIAAGGFALAGVAYLAGHPWSPGLAAAASVASLIAATFIPWWSAAILLGLTILSAAWKPLADQLASD